MPTASPTDQIRRITGHRELGKPVPNTTTVAPINPASSPAVAVPAVRRSAQRLSSMKPCVARRPPATHQPHHAPMALPTPIASDHHASDTGSLKPLPKKVTIFAPTAPTKIPGSTRGPRIINAANANPAGGQNGLALVFSKANTNAMRAVQKYTNATRITSTGRKRCQDSERRFISDESDCTDCTMSSMRMRVMRAPVTDYKPVTAACFSNNGNAVFSACAIAVTC